MHLNPVFAPSVANSPGPRDPMPHPTKIAEKESHQPNSNVVGPKTPKANVVTQQLALEKKKNKSIFSTAF